MTPTIAKNTDHFLALVASTKPEQRVRIDRRATIDVGWASDGNGRLVPAANRVEKVVCFVHMANGVKWAKTESGDVWPVIPHKKPHIADYYALGGIPK